MSFVTKVYNRLFRNKHSFLVIGGDFNLPFSPTSDRPSLIKKTPPTCLSKQSTQFRQVIRKFALFDAWRVEHPTDRQYSHYSHPFHTHARLDYFFVNAPSLRALTAVNILLISWSDPAPIAMTLKLHPSKVKQCHWRLNDFLLKDLTYRLDMEKTLKLYFVENNTPEISVGTLWEAHKAVIREQSIAISTAWKKNAKLLRQRTTQRLQKLESRLPSSSSIRLLREIIRLRAILKSIDMGRVEKALLRLRQLYYDKGNKAHTLLARKLRESTYTIRKASLNSFKNYYSELYNNPSIPHLPIQRTFKDRVQSYLATSGVSTLPVEALDSLNSPITDEDISSTLKHLPYNKAPGPDGLPYEYYN